MATGGKTILAKLPKHIFVPLLIDLDLSGCKQFEGKELEQILRWLYTTDK
jgi:hypothetical protein